MAGRAGSTATPSEVDEPHASVAAARSRGRRHTPHRPLANGSSLRVVDNVRAGAPRERAAEPSGGWLAAAPPLCRGYVSRPRLVRRLAAADCSLILISAPAGHGKTSLVCEWAQADARAFAFVMLEDADNDAEHLRRKLAAALAGVRGIDRGAIDRRCAALDHNGAPAAWDRAWGAATWTGRSRLRKHAPVLVLDDVHAVRARESLSLIKVLAGVAQPHAPLVLASRSIPALPLARLRAARSLLTLDAEDLAMTLAEATGLVRAVAPEVDRNAVEQLLQRTRGWPAALYLTARSLGDGRGRAAGVARADAGERATRSYVEEELLGTCSPRTRRFLARTSILEPLSASLCDAVLERRDSQSMLSAAVTKNLAAAALDESDGAYRCHPLVRDALRAELERLEPGAARELHRRASDWFHERGDVDRALSHAVAADDTAFAAELLWTNCARYLTDGREAEYREWLGRFSERQLASSAALSLCAAHTHLAAGELGAAEHWARVASSALERSSGRAREHSLQAGIALVEAAGGRLGLTRMAADAERAYELTDVASPWRALCRLLGGVAYHLAGERQRARVALEEGVALGLCVAPQPASLCLAQLALLAAQEDEWDRASDLVASARGRVEGGDLAQSAISALVFAIGAWVSAREGLAAEAKRDLRHCAQLVAKLGEFMPWYEVETRVAMARACIRLADLARARAQLSHASRLARRMPEVSIFRTWLDEAWAEIDNLGACALSDAGSLTMAELRILRFLPTHLSFGEIGARLHVSTNTVKSQAHAIYRKLGVASRSEAVTRASTLGLIEAGMI